MQIKSGGAVSNLQRINDEYKRIESITFSYEKGSKSVEMWINGDCLSYLSFEEMIALKEELREALQKMIE